MEPRHLVLLRHAKSSWDDTHIDDHDRPLNPRGRRAAAQVGRYLRQQRVVLDLVLCSPALRTRQTLELLELDGAPHTLFESDLYGATAGEVLDRLRRVDDAISSVMVIGHNPAMHELAVALSGDPHRIASLPTAALAELSLPSGGWSDLHAAGATLDRLVTPKDLPPPPC